MPKQMKLDLPAPEVGQQGVVMCGKLLGALISNRMLTFEQVNKLGDELMEAYDGVDDDMWALGFNLNSNYREGLEDATDNKWTDIK